MHKTVDSTARLPDYSSLAQKFHPGFTRPSTHEVHLRVVELETVSDVRDTVSLPTIADDSNPSLPTDTSLPRTKPMSL